MSDPVILANGEPRLSHDRYDQEWRVSEPHDTHADLVVAAVRRDPALFLDQEITPFATPRRLMGGGPPSKLRLFARRRWFRSLRARCVRELHRQDVFSRVIRLAARMGAE